MDTSPDGQHPAVPVGFRIVEISREPVELYKILKFQGMADSGGQARAAVASGRVLVNGAIETQKRKKIRSGDTIEFGNDKLLIRFCAPTDPEAIAEKAAAAGAGGG